jgi:hypothetical protein
MCSPGAQRADPRLHAPQGCRLTQSANVWRIRRAACRRRSASSAACISSGSSIQSPCRRCPCQARPYGFAARWRRARRGRAGSIRVIRLRRPRSATSKEPSGLASSWAGTSRRYVRVRPRGSIPAGSAWRPAAPTGSSGPVWRAGSRPCTCGARSASSGTSPTVRPDARPRRAPAAHAAWPAKSGRCGRVGMRPRTRTGRPAVAAAALIVTAIAATTTVAVLRMPRLHRREPAGHGSSDSAKSSACCFDAAVSNRCRPARPARATHSGERAAARAECARYARTVTRSLIQRVHNPRNRRCGCDPDCCAGERRSAELSSGGFPAVTSAFTRAVVRRRGKRAQDAAL